MKVLYERSFLKDVKKLNDKRLKESINSFIDEIKSAENLHSVHKIEKLKGHSNAFKLKIGDYRIGLFYEDDQIIFSRFLHRKKIYEKFP